VATVEPEENRKAKILQKWTSIVSTKSVVHVDIATDNIMNCYGLQTLQANEVMTRKAYIKTPDKLNSVLFMIAFVSSEEEALREPCLESP